MPRRLALAVFAGTFVFGGYLALLTLLGYENMQAFTALDHPGFKHFVRLRVRADGRGIDGWCVGAPTRWARGSRRCSSITSSGGRSLTARHAPRPRRPERRTAARNANHSEQVVSAAR